MTTPFTLPTAWIAEQYPTHHSFAYESNRDDYDFRVEFTAGVPESEQLAVIGLIESAPKLLASMERLLRAFGAQSTWVLTGDLNEALDEACAAVTTVTGKGVV